MPAEWRSYLPLFHAALLQQVAEDLNAGAIGHVRHTQNEVPVDSGRLQESTRVEEKATAGNLRAVVMQGGIEVRGKLVNYAEEVELGFNAQPNFVPGMDVGRQIILERGRRGR